MVIGNFYNGIEIHRNEKIVIIKFLMPHRVISTCRANGGLHDDFDLIYNHQSCEPAGHIRKSNNLAVSAPSVYLQHLCHFHGISENCASLGTAANMNCAVVKSEKFRDLEVITVCTGGVETNAGRAGDPAYLYESKGEFESLWTKSHDPCGTINIIVCINRDLTPGAMVQAVVMATEAKAAVLQELNIGSCYSSDLATGTGTDQLAIACAIGEEFPLTTPGKHTKLGELIGLTVKKALAEALKLQNSMPPESRCSVLAHLKRFGADIQSTKKGIGQFLSEKSTKLLNNNFISIDRDPVTVAAAAALVHMRDELVWKILPENCLPEIFSTYGAHLSAAVSGKYDRFVFYKNRLEEYKSNLDNKFSLDSPEFLELIYFCISAGFEEKWKDCM